MYDSDSEYYSNASLIDAYIWLNLQYIHVEADGATEAMKNWIFEDAVRDEKAFFGYVKDIYKN